MDTTTDDWKGFSELLDDFQGACIEYGLHHTHPEKMLAIKQRLIDREADAHDGCNMGEDL